ncbi:hypothetical protein O4214_30275 [Rhodococcus erythropolis]|uniref:hypothetical protein n=1 Tax=Rhodococcus erythropolis TaxID=1833 RepID=UPI001E2BC666|nr:MULTISPECIES: hypothetical protein [Rhodococcus erythropolis group]MCD2109352.1 hypothetical protein [Rhodococcus qingshengii]MCZ4528277.1 hypothetical protein [Rhodococcus erythropolis]
MGVAPDRPYPDNAYGKRGTMRGFQDIDEAEAKRRMRKPIDDANNTAHGKLFGGLFSGFSGFGSLLENLATAFFGSGPFDPSSALGRISDKSMADAAKIVDMQNRTQILEGIIGYGSWVASQNLFLSIDQNNAGARTMSFDRQVGPSVGVTLVPDSALAGKKVQRLDSQGLWQVLAQTRSRRTIYSGTAKVYMDIVVKDPSGNEHYRRSMDQSAISSEGGDGEITLTNNVFFTVPGPGYTVRVDLFSGQWRWFYGGSQWSGLSILKHSSEVQNPGTVDPGTPPVAG